MSLVVMFRSLKTDQCVGAPDPAEGGWRTIDVLRREDFVGLEDLASDAVWHVWEDQEVEVLVAHTEASPSTVRWKSWYLAYELATDLMAGQGR